ncbi:MAG: hypothetical protein IT519_03415 [Burkholderiales bacterium]|nr:hypothetical protein [Burkholderiales bacterium]
MLLASSPAFAQSVAGEARAEAIELDGQSLVVDVYLPAATAPTRAAIIAHGWTRSREQHRDQARALAQAGFVAIVPDLPNVLDLWGNGRLIVDLVESLETGALGLPPLPRSSIVLIGTSAGGLATVHAASKLPGIAGWIGLDPVDRTGTGIYAASMLEAPAIVLIGDASACNLFGSGRSIARAAPHLVRSVRIRGASHCDFESPTSKFCTSLCGRASHEKQQEVADATVAAALELLSGSPAGTAQPARDGGGEPTAPPHPPDARPRDEVAPASGPSVPDPPAASQQYPDRSRIP